MRRTDAFCGDCGGGVRPSLQYDDGPHYCDACLDNALEAMGGPGFREFVNALDDAAEGAAWLFGDTV